MRQQLLVIAIPLILFVGCLQKRLPNLNSNVKYVFLFIGDGMGLQPVNATQVYIDSVLKNNQPLSFINFPAQTFATTYAANQYITCSAAAGTALSTGSKTSIGTLGLNYNHTDSLFSIAKKFKENGFKVGLLTSVCIDHATPAAFYAHQGSRGSSYNIAKDLLKSGYDFYASGGFLDPFGKMLKDSVESIYSLGQKYSFAFTTSISAIDSLAGKFKSIVYATPHPASESTLKYNIDRDSSDITLAELTKKAIQTLNNPKGFFMMVEGGKIDWACHDNDAATTISEVINFSNAVKQAVNFYNTHPDETLIIVTADHETGGFSLGNKENKYSLKLSLLKSQRVSKEQLHEMVNVKFNQNPTPTFEQMLEFIEDKIGLGNINLQLGLVQKDIKSLKEAYISSTNTRMELKTATLKGIPQPEETFSATCIDILNRKAAIGWTSTTHTGSPVPVFALGVDQELFTGRIDITDIPRIIRKVVFKE